MRPWQHVLEPLAGYLILARHLAEGRQGADAGWNFGPETGQERPVIAVADALVRALGTGEIEVQPHRADLHEARLLQLDSGKARALGWRPLWSFDDTVRLTAGWYAAWHRGADPRELCLSQIEQYERDFAGT